jgi:hypothetical protein
MAKTSKAAKEAATFTMEPVKSSAIKAIAHNPETNTLRVEFKNGGIYDYAGVDANKHAALAGAESIGAHFRQHILGVHEHTRIG